MRMLIFISQKMSKCTNTYSQSNWKYDKRKTNIYYNEKDV